MGLLAKLKSMLGMDRSAGVEPDVTVEREPRDRTETGPEGTGGAAETEDAEDGDAAESEAGETETEETDTETPESDDRTAGEDETAEMEETEETGEEPIEEAEPTPVQEIKGIGPAYADRLGDAGVGTVADLAEADAASLAAETELSETRIEDWIEQARARTHKR